MEIVDGRCGVLSHYEVYQFLREQRRVPSWEALGALMNNVAALQQYRRPVDRVGKQPRRPPKGLPFLVSDIHVPWAPLNVSAVSDRWTTNDFRTLAPAAWVRERTMKYLAAQPCAHQSKKKILLFFERVNEFLAAEKLQLTVGEIRALIDLQPTCGAELQTLIDRLDERIDDKQAARLVQIVQTTLTPLTADEDTAQRQDEMKEEHKQRLAIEEEREAEQKKYAKDNKDDTHDATVESTTNTPLYMQLLSSSAPLTTAQASESLSPSSASAASSSAAPSHRARGSHRGRGRGRGRGGGGGGGGGSGRGRGRGKWAGKSTR